MFCSDDNIMTRMVHLFVSLHSYFYSVYSLCFNKFYILCIFRSMHLFILNLLLHIKSAYSLFPVI